MIPKRDATEDIDERGIGSIKYARLSRRANGKRKIINVLALVLIALMLSIYAFYHAKLVLGTPIWGGFWAFTIFIAVWLITGVVRILRQTDRETDKRTPSVQDRR